MGIDKRGVGGFLQMFDWNGRSRKKLFSSKSDMTEQSKPKKRCDGNRPTSRLQMREEDEIAAGSSIKGSTDHSCASSVIDAEIYGTKAPGVVARLMGLDSLPKSSLHEPQTPLFDSQTLRDAYYRRRRLEYGEDQILPSDNSQGVLLRDDIGRKYQRVMNKPMDKFQTEVLPPRSAKLIPITHHKLLSPIKSGSYVPSKDAAHIMEAAARIIVPAHQASTRVKLPPVGSSSVPLRVKDLKEKAKVAQKTRKTFDGCQEGKAESSAFENLRDLSMSKSWNGPAYGASLRILPDMQEPPSGCMKNKGKSVSLALQAKANVQKRESSSVSSSSTSLVSQKEACGLRQSQLLTSPSTMRKQSTQSGSGVLLQNNQKQNYVIERGKLTFKCNSKGGKTFTGESSSARQRNSSKPAGTSKVSSRKLSTFDKYDKREESCSSQERVTHKKRSIDGNYHLERHQASENMAFNQSGKAILSSSIMGSHNRWDEDLGLAGSDVVSFTFTAPMKRSGHSAMSREAGYNGALFSSNSQNKRPFMSSDSNCSPRFSPLGQSLKGDDALSNLLEQKLKELAQKVEFSKVISGEELHSIQPNVKAIISSSVRQRNMDKMHADNQALSDSSTSQTRKFVDCRLPSPISVLDHSSFVDSCNSDTADSSSTGSKPISSIQTQEVLDTYSSKTPFLIEGDAELSDSASSTFPRTVVKRQQKNLILADSKKPRTWEQEYITEMLHNIESKYQDYALSSAHEIISPFIFGVMGSRKPNSTACGATPRVNHRLLSDSVCESLELRFRHFVGGGSKLWAKGLSVVRRKERLADEIFKEITGCKGIGDSMIDELVDKDMSSPHGRWLDFHIEAFELGIQVESRILSSLIEEVIGDIMALQLRQTTSYLKSSVRFPSSVNSV